MRIGLFGTLIAAAASLGGCNTQPYCDALTRCGGDYFNGEDTIEWVATAQDACIDQIPAPVSPLSLALTPPRPAGIRAVEPSTTDWCGGLVLSNDGTVKAFDDGWYENLKKYNGWFPSIPLYTAQLVFDHTFHYTLTTVQLAHQEADFTQTCRVAQGISLSCSDLSSELKTFVQKRLGGISGLKAVVYDNTCSEKDGGCACGYNVQLTTTTTGPYLAPQSDRGEINFFDAQAAPPAKADYCARTGSLLLTGNDETDLFNRRSLKTLKLRPATCSDGLQSYGEEGIDCGGVCPTACQ